MSKTNVTSGPPKQNGNAQCMETKVLYDSHTTPGEPRCISSAASPAHPGGEVEVLPGATQGLGMVDHADPVQLVHRHLDIVGVRPEDTGNHSLF